MVGAVEPIHRQQLELAAQGFTLDVTGDHRQIGAHAEIGVLQKPGERRAGHHGFDAGQHAGVGALFHHRQQKIQALAEQARARSAHRYVRVP